MISESPYPGAEIGIEMNILAQNKIKTVENSDGVLEGGYRNGYRICAVIPAFNEAATVGKVVYETKKWIEDVFVVDNGSVDDTGKIARENGAEVICYSEKRGYGAAQYAGQQTAIARGYDYILQLDGDGQHDPKYIPHLIGSAIREDCDFVIASRFLKADNRNFSFARRIGIRFFSTLVSLLGKTKVTDVTSGFKVYKTEALKSLDKPNDLHPAVGQVLTMSRRGMKIREVPVEMSSRRNGKSHLSPGRFAIYPLRVMSIILMVLWLEFRK